MGRTLGVVALAALLAGCSATTLGSGTTHHRAFTITRAAYYGYSVAGCLTPTLYSPNFWTPDFQLIGPGNGHFYLFSSVGKEYLTPGRWTGSFGYLAPFNSGLRDAPPQFKPVACAWKLRLTQSTSRTTGGSGP